MQKKCKPNGMELAPIAEMQPFFYKRTLKKAKNSKIEHLV